MSVPSENLPPAAQWKRPKGKTVRELLREAGRDANPAGFRVQHVKTRKCFTLKKGPILPRQGKHYFYTAKPDHAPGGGVAADVPSFNAV